MPRQTAITDIGLGNIIARLTPAVTLLKELNGAFGPPFVQPISNTIESLLQIVQNIKRNKSKCIQLMENIHNVVYAIINLHLKSEPVGSLPPAMLDSLGKFMETLHKTYIFLEVQQDRHQIKHLFRNNEMQSLLKDCRAGLDQAVEVFGITTGPAIFNDIGEMKKATELMHQELLELIHTLSDGNTSSDGSSIYLGSNESKNSSSSFSMLPAMPKIFYGRESELDHIVKMLCHQSPKIAILGGGGMGKTSLARAVLHHPDISASYECRFFISAESATNSVDLVALIGLHIGLDPGKDLTKAVVQYFSRQPLSLLILDNLETVWEPRKSRSGVEEFLSLLTEVEHLALIITMRGAERPARVHWTHPFLVPLQPLSGEAAQQTFMDITDNSYTNEDIHQILQFTDNMPLAVDLIAHLSNYESLSNVLTRWETEKTALLSIGYDRKSNLDASIRLSLSSPCLTPDSKQFLGLLSILPDGLSDTQLVHSNFGIPNILSCKSALLATSLAYQDGNKQLKLLVPLREHIQQFLPPSQFLIQCIRNHFYALLELYRKYNGEQLQPVVNQITLNLGNLQEVLQQGLHDGASNLADTIYCTFSLNSFNRVTGRSYTSLMHYIRPILARLCDPQLDIHFTIEVLSDEALSDQYYPSVDREKMITQAIPLVECVDNPLLGSKFYQAAGHYLLCFGLDLSKPMYFLHKALELSKLSGDINEQGNVLRNIAWLKYMVGDCYAAQVYATEGRRLSKLSVNMHTEAKCLSLEAVCFTHFGDFRQSMTLLHSGSNVLGICGISGGCLDHAMAMAQGENLLLKSEYGQARSTYSHIIQTHSPECVCSSYALAIMHIAQIDTKIGRDAEDVHQNLKKAKNILKNYAFRAKIIFCSMLEAEVELREGKFDLAKAKLQECLHSALQNQIELYCLEQLADIRAWPTSDWQSRWPVVYCGLANKSKARLELHKALLFLGDMFIINEDEHTATSLYIVALEGFTYTDVHRSRAQCMMRLGDLAKGHGHISDAIAHWKAARPLFEQSFQARDAADIDARLLAVEKFH